MASSTGGGPLRSASGAAAPANATATPPSALAAALAATGGPFSAPPVFAFDVDSTLITTEGIDELAAFAGKGAEVAALTKSAMGGSMPFSVALDRRLALLQPTAPLLARFLLAHPPALTPRVREVFDALVARGGVA
jgi:phosphoserine phosphatase